MQHGGSDEADKVGELVEAGDGDAQLVPEIEPAPETEDAPAQPSGPLAVIDRFRLAQLRSRKELEAVEIVLDARLTEMRHAAEAAAEESRARWNARTAEVVSALKTVVQAQLRGIENERMEQRFEAIERAYETFAAKVREVETGPLPDELRQDLVHKLRAHLTATIERLENDAIAGRYDLKD